MAPTYFQLLATELGQPTVYDGAGGVAAWGQQALQQMAASMQSVANNYTQNAATAQQYANAWARVNSTFVPQNPIEANMLRIGQQIEQSYRNTASYNLGAGASQAQLSAVAKSWAATAGGIVGLFEMGTKWYEGGTWEIGQTSLGMLTGLGGAALGAVFLAAQGIALGNPIGIATTIALGFLGSKAGEAAWAWLVPRDYSSNVIELVSDFFDLSQRTTPRRDPLTLDLDGDGLETVGVAAGVLFDHDGDGVRSGTGWVSGDDGFLVLDRNANGVIDSGRELFGDSTPLAGGGTALDGFAALAQEDTNLDGRVDSLDTNWSNLRVWRDLNQDGFSQSGELFTLDSLGIAALNVAASEHTRILPNGNQVADLGSYVRSDGSTGTLGETSQMADVNLADDTFNRQFSDTVPLTPEAQNLPDMQGSGLVRDLREAASQSAALAALLAQYAAAPTRAAQLALLDQLLDAWADTSNLAERMEERTSQYRFRFMAFGDVRRSEHVALVDGSGSPYEDFDATDVTLGEDTTLNRLDASYRGLIEEWNQRIHILEAFNGRYFFNLPGLTQAGLSAADGMIELNDGRHYDAVGGVGTLMIGYSQGQLDLRGRGALATNDERWLIGKAA